MEIKENAVEIVSNNAITEVNSSNKVLSALFVICKDVITIKQKPNKFEDVFNICCEVLFAIVRLYHVSLRFF